MALKLQRILLQGRDTLSFFRKGLRSMKGWPLLGSLRMLSLGFLPDRQVTYGLGARPSRSQTKLFFTDLQRGRMFSYSATRMRYRRLLHDKVRFAELVSSFASTPKILAVIEAGRLFPLSTDVPTPDANGLFAATRVHDGLVLKPRIGAFGRGVFFLTPADRQLRLDRELIEPATLEGRIRELGSYIVTPKVRQAQYAAELFGKTTNVIRVLTMVDPKNGEAFAAMAGHKIGTEASFPVDNPGSGGLYSIIDLKTGRLGVGVTESGSRHIRHPNSGTQIEGVLIPHWTELLVRVVHLAQHLDFLEYVGWDIVITEGDFSVIEGNYNPDFLPLPLLADERIRAFYRHCLSYRKSRTPSKVKA